MHWISRSSARPITAPGILIVNSILLSIGGNVLAVKRIPLAEMFSVTASIVPSGVVTCSARFIGKRTAVRTWSVATAALLALIKFPRKSGLRRIGVSVYEKVYRSYTKLQ